MGAQQQVLLAEGFAPQLAITYLVLAGGGGGGRGGGAGGGAGGLLQGSTSLTPGSYPIVIGTGGPGATVDNTSGTPGNDTTAFGLTAKGGGRGAGGASIAGGPGGSGGGGSQPAGAGGAATAGQGNNGGGVAVANNGGGGGGAGSTGGSPTSTNGGNGGNGVSSSISGSALLYAGGRRAVAVAAPPAAPAEAALVALAERVLEQGSMEWRTGDRAAAVLERGPMLATAPMAPSSSAIPARKWRPAERSRLSAAIRSTPSPATVRSCSDGRGALCLISRTRRHSVRRTKATLGTARNGSSRALRYQRCAVISRA